MTSATVGALKVFLGLDMAEFDGGLKAARNQLMRAGRQMEATGRQIAQVGTQLSLGLSLPLAAFGAATVKAASDAQEMGSAFRYVFGAAARDVEAWAEKTGNALGRSTYVLQQQALTFQQLFKQAAPTNQAAAEMSKQFTLLAQDLASFFNVAEDDALTKLRAGLVGEAEPLRAFGVFLTAAAVEAKALQLGLAATSKELTEQDKIMARAALITEATKDAQGDAARTADSFANKAKALKAAVNELQVSLGSALLPSLTQVATAAASALNGFNALSPGVQQTALALAGVALAIGPANVAIGAMVSAAGAATKAIAGLTAGAGGLKVAMTGIAAFLGPGGLLVIGMAAAGVAALALYHHFKGLDKTSRQVAYETGELTEAVDDYERAALAAAAATGESRKELVAEAKAIRLNAAFLRDMAAARLEEARARLAQAMAAEAAAVNDRGAGNAEDPYSRLVARGAGTKRAEGEFAERQKALAEAVKRLEAADKRLAESNKLLEDSSPPAIQAIGKKTDALDKEAKALEEAKTANRGYLAAAQKTLAEARLSDNEREARQAMIRAHEAYLMGLIEEAVQWGEVAAAYRAGDVELKKVSDTQSDFIDAVSAGRREWSKWWDDLKRRFEEIEDGFYRARNAVDDLFYGIRNNDWVGAFGGLMRAIDQIKIAFDSAASSGARMAAASGAVSAVGNAIGGKVGGALSGAASGAAAGATFGPVGAVVGGILGGLGGLFGASKAKKRAKREAAERARLEAEQRAAELAAAKRALELRLLELGGDAAGALAARREDELAAMDASLRALQQDVWAREDAAEAARRAAEMVAATRALEIEKLQALGREEEALAMIRAEALAELPAELRDLQQSIWDVIDATQAAETAQDRYAEVQRDQADQIADAEGRVADAREALGEAARDEISALETLRDTFADLAEELAGFGRELSGGAFGNLSLGQQLSAAERAFAAVEGRTDAESLSRLPGLGRALIEAQSAVAPNQRVLQATIDRVRAATRAGEIAARGQVSAAEQEIAALNQTATALGALNNSVLSLRDAQDQLAEALKQQAAVMAQAAAAIASAGEGLSAAMAAAAQAANTNVAPVTAAALDVAAATAGLDATVATGAVSADSLAASMADQVADRLLPVLTSQAMSAATTASLNKRWNVDGMPEVRDLDDVA